MERIGIEEWTVVLIGMGTVFVALIALSLVLSLFAVVSKMVKGKSRGKRKEGTEAPAPSAAGSAPAASTGISAELVAVLTAAVSAASGRNANEFRITRVAPSSPGISGLNTPVWGYANRLARRGRDLNLR